jgi:hypothetical protein
MKYIRLIHDPAEETEEAFEVRKAEAIAATGEPDENVTVIVSQIVHWNPNTNQHGHS